MNLVLSCLLLAVAAVSAESLGLRTTSDDPLASCPGYKASHIKTTPSSLTADLTLAGKACNVYGDDLDSLTLSVVYETGRLCYSTIQSNVQILITLPQMIEYTSRSKMLVTVSTKFQPQCFHVPLQHKGSIRRTQISYSSTQPLHSRSPLLEPRQGKFSSILQLQASCLSPNTSDFGPHSQTTQISMG